MVHYFGKEPLKSPPPPLQGGAIDSIAIAFCGLVGNDKLIKGGIPKSNAPLFLENGIMFFFSNSKRMIQT